MNNKKKVNLKLNYIKKIILNRDTCIRNISLKDKYVFNSQMNIIYELPNPIEGCVVLPNKVHHKYFDISQNINNFTNSFFSFTLPINSNNILPIIFNINSINSLYEWLVNFITSKKNLPISSEDSVQSLSKNPISSDFNSNIDSFQSLSKSISSDSDFNSNIDSFQSLSTNSISNILVSETSNYIDKYNNITLSLSLYETEVLNLILNLFWIKNLNIIKDNIDDFINFNKLLIKLLYDIILDINIVSKIIIKIINKYHDKKIIYIIKLKKYLMKYYNK